MKARKLPSGSWNIRVYSHKDPSGKQIYESFTASSKREAEVMAAKFKADTDRRRTEDITIEQAVTNYLEANKSVLSPSTIYGYTKDSKRFETINHLKIRKLTSKDLQSYISYLVDQGLSPKTVKNTYGLLRTVLTFSGVDKNFMIHLPSNPKRRKFAPENEQIAALYNNANHKMKIAISLAAFHSLRRGEIAGLKYGDLKGNTLYIHSDVVKSADGKSWVHKEIPKTEVSNRTIFLSESEVELIGKGDPDDYIVDLTPGSIGTNFYNLKKKVGIEIRFHDLRVYFASISVAMGMSETTLAHLGGWREGSQAMRDHYKKSIMSIDEGYANKMNNYFENMKQNM